MSVILLFIITKTDWKIIYYQYPNGKEPIYDFIESLSPVAQAKVSNTFDLLLQFGIRLGLPHVKKISNTDLWELRILGGDSIRIIYIATTGKQFLLLHGFVKKTQKTDKRELKIAQSRLKEFNHHNITKL
ncbi:MAG: type II toxin-antitoxin system RelE/ParE family toxin [Microgenomates group bacterium]